MNIIKFTKMHGLGNDYIYINCVDSKNNFLDLLLDQDQNQNNLFKLTKKLSDRHFGIGADGVILILKSDNINTADFKMRIINSDGSEAQMCGNGIRCVGKFIYENNLIPKNKLDLNIQTLAGIKKLNLSLENNLINKIKVNMGQACFEPKKIPVLTQDNSNIIKLKILDKNFICNCVSIGNPHAVIFINNLNSFNASKYGYLLENNSCFPEKINIEFAEIINKDHIKIKVWERGSGITLACGTGACAVYSIALKNNLINKNKDIKLELPGGFLDISCDQNKNIFMSGPAENIFTGYFNLKDFI